MSSRQPVKWPRANQAHAEFSREQKRPPAPATISPEKTPPKITAAVGVPSVSEMLQASQKNAASGCVFDTSKTALPEVVRAVEKAVKVTDKVVAGSDQATGARKVKGLLGPVAFDGTMVVWSMPRMNRRLLIAYKKGTDPENPLNLFNILVRENLNFMAGMLVPGPHGKLNEVNRNTYELLGACPRWKGRW